MKKKLKTGNIVVPHGAMVQPHEFAVAIVLSQTGHDVEFLPISHIHTADINFLSKTWEIKSPKGSSSRTIENNMRVALKQSENIIIDLSRIKIKEGKALNEIRRQANLIKQIKNILIITKSHKIIEL